MRNSDGNSDRDSQSSPQRREVWDLLMAATGYDPHALRMAFEAWLAACGKQSTSASSLPAVPDWMKPPVRQQSSASKVEKLLLIASSSQCRELSSSLRWIFDVWWLAVCNSGAVRANWDNLISRTLHWVALEVVRRRELETSRIQRQRIESQIAATRANALGALGAGSKDAMVQKKAPRVDVRLIEKQAVEIEEALTQVREELERKQRLGKGGASKSKVQREKKQQTEQRVEELRSAIANLNCSQQRTANAFRERQKEYVRSEALARQELERCAGAIENCRARTLSAQAVFRETRSAKEAMEVLEEPIEKPVYQLNLRSPSLLGSQSGEGDSLMFSTDLGERSETDRSTATLLQDTRSALPSPTERQFVQVEPQTTGSGDQMWIPKTGYVVTQQTQQLPARSALLPAPPPAVQSVPASMSRSMSDTSLITTQPPPHVLKPGDRGRFHRMQIGPLQSAQRQGNAPVRSFQRP